MLAYFFFLAFLWTETTSRSIKTKKQKLEQKLTVDLFFNWNRKKLNFNRHLDVWMLLCRVYHVIAIYPKRMGKRQGINEWEIYGNQSSTAERKLKTNEFLTSLPRDREVDSACLNCCLLKFTARKLREFALNFSEFYDLNQNLQLNNTLRTLRIKIIFAVLENYPLVAKLQLKSERWLCSFQGIIRIAFGNEVPLTPKRISSLERSTFSLFFEKSIVD